MCLLQTAMATHQRYSLLLLGVSQLLGSQTLQQVILSPSLFPVSTEFHFSLVFFSHPGYPKYSYGLLMLPGDLSKIPGHKSHPSILSSDGNFC